MSDAQTWTTIGGFLAAVVAMSAMLLRMVQTEVSSVRTEISSLRSEIELSGSMTMSEIAGLRTETHAQVGGFRGQMMARFDTVERRIDGLDADVQVLTRRVFGVEE